MNKIASIILLSSALVFWGCEKQKNIVEQLSEGAKNAVGFGSSNSDGIVADVDAAVTPQLDQAVNVFLSGQTYGSEVTVSVAADPSVIDEYNTNNGTAYAALPSDAYTAPTSISIPANAKEGTGTLSVDINKLLTYGTQFAIGLSINSVSGGPGNVLEAHSKLFVLVRVKNAYDADYAVSGYFFHPSAPRGIGMTKHLTTVDANSSETELGDLGGAGYLFAFTVSGTSLTNWTAVEATPAAPESGFMTTDNPGNVDYSAAAPDNPGTAPWVSTTYNNTYDDATKTFWMHYGYGVGANGEAGFTRQVYEKWVRK